MSTKNSQEVNETLGTNATEDKSLVRTINYSCPGGLSKLNCKKSAAFACDTEGKTCANSSKIPRPPLTASNSFNATLKSNQSEGKTKKPPSMIPRSRSRKRNENDKVKFDIPSKTESLKNELNDTRPSNNKKLNSDSADQKSGVVLQPYETPSKSFDLEMKEENNEGEKLIKISSLSLKSCQDFVEVTKEGSDTSYKDAQEEILSTCLASKVMSRKEQEPIGPPKAVNSAEDKGNDDLEGAKQERTIRNLYEILKCTVGPLLDNFKWISRENVANGETERLYSESPPDKVINNYESVPDFSSIQGHYEFTLKEISNIWKNTISLIGSVRDHAVKFVEGNNKSVDKEQLTLEAEMLQLALDFAISYSKLKTDFLVNLVKKRLHVNSLEKTDVENFMDSKTFAALYSNDDLAAMARTVQDLNASLLKGEDQELE